MGKESNRPYARDGKPYVRDAGWAGRGPLGEAALSAAMVMLALAAGFAVGFLVWAVLSLANGLVALLWDALGKRGGEGFAMPWFPLVVCTLGGLVIGVWTHFPQGAPAPLETVMASFKKTGSYRVEGAERSVVGFLLPIVFGGSVGPRGGLDGSHRVGMLSASRPSQARGPARRSDWRCNNRRERCGHIRHSTGGHRGRRRKRA